MDLDETELKAEIERISDKIDDIMQKVNRLYPQQELKPPSIRATHQCNSVVRRCHGINEK